MITFVFRSSLIFLMKYRTPADVQTVFLLFTVFLVEYRTCGRQTKEIFEKGRWGKKGLEPLI